MTIGNQMRTEVRAEATGLANLLTSGTFTVPWHQRRYDWDQNNVQELLEDIQEAVNSSRPRLLPRHNYVGRK